VEGFDPAHCQQPLNRWIVNEVMTLTDTLTQALEAYHFHEASQALYQFVWGRFCDWYLEFTKPILTGQDEAAQSETRATTAWVLGRILHLMHPFMPFISEELWLHLKKNNQDMLITSSWPSTKGFTLDQRAQEDMEWLIELISEIRSLRTGFNIPTAARITLQVMEAREDTYRRLNEYKGTIERLSRVVIQNEGEGVLEEGVQLVASNDTYLIPLKGVIDIQQERQRLQTALDEVREELQKLKQKLGNEDFIAKAPEAVVQANQQRYEEANLKQEKLAQALNRLSQAV